MLTTLILTLAAAAAPAVAAPAQPAIVVTGVRLETLEADLARCVAAKCPPRDDIIATVRYAEGLFRTGRYVDAKRVLAKSVGRNKGAAASDPVVVSELYLAQANVARHEGDRRVEDRAIFARTRVLKNALPHDAPAVLLAEMSVADRLARVDPLRAGPRYADLAARAGMANRPTIAAALALRQAVVASALRRRAEAQRLLDTVSAMPGEAMAGYRLVARGLSARWAREAGDTAATEAFLATLASEPRGPTPVLVWSPPTPTPTDMTIRNPFDLPRTNVGPGDYHALQWIDVGFLIRPDGTVEDADIVRGKVPSALGTAIVRTVAARRYAPFGAVEGAGQYRVERFTVTGDYETPTRSLIRRRGGSGTRIEQMDVTGGVPRKLG